MGCDCEKDLEKKELMENPSIRMAECTMCSKFKRTAIVGPTCGTLAIPEWENGKMTACGCILNIKTKLKNKHCPQGKW